MHLYFAQRSLLKSQKVRAKVIKYWCLTKAPRGCLWMFTSGILRFLLTNEEKNRLWATCVLQARKKLVKKFDGPITFLSFSSPNLMLLLFAFQHVSLSYMLNFTISILRNLRATGLILLIQKSQARQALFWAVLHGFSGQFLLFGHLIFTHAYKCYKLSPIFHVCLFDFACSGVLIPREYTKPISRI